MSEKKKPKSKPLNMRERKFIKALAEGHCPTEAMRRAGYAESTANGKQSKKAEKVGEIFAEKLERLGLTDDALVRTLIDGLSATKVISCNIIAGDGEGMADAHSMTKDFVEVPDWQSKLKATDMGLKLKGKYPKDETDHKHSGSIELIIKEEVFT